MIWNVYSLHGYAFVINVITKQNKKNPEMGFSALQTKEAIDITFHTYIIHLGMWHQEEHVESKNG